MKLPLHLVPASLREMAEYCGESVMLAVWRTYGGGHLHVPKKPGPDNELVALLGMQQALNFCAMYGGEMLNIAKADKALRAVRNALICLQSEQGESLFCLARAHGLTERQIQTILKATPDDDAVVMQLDLFEEEESE